MLLRDDGSYLACSQQQESAPGKAAPPGSGFLIDPGQQRGEAPTQAPLDNVMRHYAWHRAASYPVVVNVGRTRIRPCRLFSTPAAEPAAQWPARL